MRQTLVIMVKEPHPGRVKTRLGRDIGYVAAAWWFRHQTRQLLRRLRDPRWTMVLAVSPDREGLCSRVWPAHLPKRPQGTGTLGERMRRQFARAPTGPVCIIGADIPGVQRHHIAEAFATLGQHDAVLGPAPDGGYWLIGLKRTRRAPVSLFDGVRWSTQYALADTVRSMKDHRIGFVAELRDVDDASDLQ